MSVDSVRGPACLDICCLVVKLVEEHRLFGALVTVAVRSWDRGLVGVALQPAAGPPEAREACA